MKKLILSAILILLFATNYGNYMEKLELAEEKIEIAEEQNDLSYLYEAFEIYLSLSKQMPDNSYLYYNLSVVSKLLQNDGNAVFYLRKALQLEPNSQKYQEAYEQLSAPIASKYNSVEKNKPLHYIFPIFFNISILGKVALGVFSLLIALVLVLFLKKKKKFYSLIFFAFALLMFLYAIVGNLTKKQEAVLLLDSYAYSGNSSFFEEIYSQPLPAGSVVKILKEQKGWFYVKLPDGEKVWLKIGGLRVVE
ncbi:MAG: SH3 domain-containing protein [Spirochaetales bacterium]|nr:SH3 domain-containing protein [Spirochaetales bacterium]